MALSILKGGILALVQDLGRYGLQHKGITTGGPMDEHAFLWGNRLLDNHANAPQIEISVGNFVARFSKSTTIAVCGADLSAVLNQTAIMPWQTYNVNAGDIIQFKTPKTGIRAYLAVKGGFLLDTHLNNSCASVERDQLGGLQAGQPLKKEDALPFSSCDPSPVKVVPYSFVPDYRDRTVLRVIPMSHNGCSQAHFNALLDQDYTVLPNSNRMGYRLQGKPITDIPSGVISQGVSLGAIQLPQDGQPIILMKDKQTMGGYPQVGCVAYLDLNLLAQCRPGTTVIFKEATVSEMERELRVYKQFFKLEI